MSRSTRTALLVAIILVFAGGVATAIVRESRDEGPTAAAPGTTVPAAPRPPAQPLAPTVPTTVAATVPRSVALNPITVVPPVSPTTVLSSVPPTTAATPSGAASRGGPTSTTLAPPLTAMPNTGGRSVPPLGMLLAAAGLLGWCLSGRGRPTG